MRLFKYKVDIYVPDMENQGNYTVKGMVMIQDDSKSNDDVKGIIEQNELYLDDESVIKFNLEQIPIY
jgi:hypothetical protein